MKHLVEFPLEDDSTVLVESDEPEKGPVVRGITPHEVAEKAEQTFEAAIEKIRPIAAAIIAQIARSGRLAGTDRSGVRRQARREGWSVPRFRRHRGYIQSDIDLEARSQGQECFKRSLTARSELQRRVSPTPADWKLVLFCRAPLSTSS
jgi:hypothetical protein